MILIIMIVGDGPTDALTNQPSDSVFGRGCLEIQRQLIFLSFCCRGSDNYAACLRTALENCPPDVTEEAQQGFNSMMQQIESKCGSSGSKQSY